MDVSLSLNGLGGLFTRKLIDHFERLGIGYVEWHGWLPHIFSQTVGADCGSGRKWEIFTGGGRLPQQVGRTVSPRGSVPLVAVYLQSHHGTLHIPHSFRHNLSSLCFMAGIQSIHSFPICFSCRFEYPVTSMRF